MKFPLWITIVIITFLVVDDAQSHWWGRRRRRRRSPPQPPPEPDCDVSDWSAWSRCSSLCATGTQSRRRRITNYPSPHCQQPSLHEQRNCGAPNGGCQERCDASTGLCSCSTGYALASDGKHCQDIDECQPNGGRGPCSHTCRNSVGSYSCSCPTGYFLGADRKTCQGKDCGRPVLPSCHVPMYSDHLGSACKKVIVSCPAGTRYNAQCHFSCPQDFAVAKITNFNLPFAKEVSRSNFQNVMPSSTCSLNVAGSPVWSNAGTFTNYYFCRRLNDPPSDIRLSKTTIKEHSRIGTVVGTLSVEVPNRGDAITYSLRQSAGEYFFKLQGNSISNTWVPRWNNLQGLKINEYRIVIRATDEGNPPMWLDKSFNITVINVNDPPYSIRISNNSVMDTATLNHVVGVLSAVDYDGPRGNLRSSDFVWSLIDDDRGRFRLQGPQVVVAAALDHQAHQYHRIIVNCTDKDPTDPRWAQVSIVINVIDTNDSPKNVRFNPYKLYENATAGFAAGEFTAYDEDGDVLVYSISQSNSDTLRTFELGQTSCVNSTINGIRHTVCKARLVLKGSIDYEVKNSYTVKVTATDPSGSFAVGEFTVHVVNLNEAPTDITLSSDTVPENSPVGTFVGQLTISDPDTSQRSPQGHVCSTNPSTPFGVSGVNLVVSEASLNYELKSSYRVTVTCTDTGVPPLSLPKVFIIKVQDRNERPEYLTLTRTSIPEDARIGSVVGELFTRDPDLGTKSLTFRVVSPANSPFEIGGIGNKSLITRSRLDYETLQQIELLISVTDDGGLSIEKYFKITIIDVNEPPTNIIISPTTFPENSPPGAVIGTIRVNDPDFNSTASCRIIGGDSQHLAISGLTLVAGSQKVNYEALGSTKSLFVTLRCSDEFNLHLDESFHIDVTDINEPPSVIDITVRPIPENRIGALVGQLTVRDVDVNQRYSCRVFYNDTESLLFMVDAPTLRLKTRRPLNFERQRQHMVTVRCDDRVNANYSQFTIFRDIGLNVMDINENPLNPCPNEIYVDEAASNGSVVWTFKPRDPDNEKYEAEKRLGLASASPKQQLTISMTTSSPSFPFQIADDKYLVKTGGLNRLVKDVYDLHLSVADDGMLVRLNNKQYETYQGPVIISNYTCRIRALASDDQRLYLDIGLSSNVISEDALNGTKVGSFSVINPKPGKTYTFALVQPEAVPFKIVGNNLILFTGVPLDYETTNSTGVGVVVVDSDGVTNQRLFEIRITNVNERPVKMCLIGNKTVMELTSNDQIIGKIFIEDEDHKSSKGICEKHSPSLDQSQIYSCSIESNIMDVTSLKQDFYIDQNLVLHGNATFNHEAKSQYLVPLLCRDRSKPIHLIELTVTVRVQDSSIKPKWDFTLSSNTVPEDAPNGTEIGTFSVVSGSPGGYTYRVSDVRKPFRVVGTKLVLVYGQPLDYETSNSTSVVIVSTNSAGVQVTKSFLIVVTNVNEKPVKLCLLDAILVTPEKSPSNPVIGRLAIEDPDHPESKDICTKSSTGAPVKYYTYTCVIYSTSMNVDEIKKKFYIDQSFQLNRKSDFDYKTEPVYNIPVMCRDRQKPIHLIESVFIVRIQAPSCPSGYKLVNGICVCSNGLSGPKCDRDLSICSRTTCAINEVCVSHVSATNRCIPRENQVPILMQVPYSVSSPLEKRYKIEGYVESIFEGRRPAGQTLQSLLGTGAVSRRRRDIPKDVYVEGAYWRKVLSFYTYCVFVAMDPQSNFKALPGKSMCALLKGTDLRCLNEEDCDLLKKAGIDCPYTFGASNGTSGNKGQSRGDSSSSSAMPAVYVVASVCVIVIVVFSLYFLKRRRRNRKSDERVYFHDIPDPVSGLNNPVYDGVSPDNSPQIPPQRAEKDNILRNNMINQASSKRPENVKTFNNKLHSVHKYDVNNPLYGAMVSQPPPYSNEPVYESIGKRLGKDTVNSMLEEEKAKSREKGFEDDVVALPKGQKGKWTEPEYASVDNLHKKQNNRNCTEMSKKKASINKKKFEGDVVDLPFDKKGKRNEQRYSAVGNMGGKGSNVQNDDLKLKNDKDSNC